MTHNDTANAQDTIVMSNDLLRGADEIARFLGISRRSVYYYAERGELPFFRIGSQLLARKSTLLRHIEKLESANAEGIQIGLLTALFR